jgi:hypothetical protein
MARLLNLCPISLRCLLKHNSKIISCPMELLKHIVCTKFPHKQHKFPKMEPCNPNHLNLEKYLQCIIKTTKCSWFHLNYAFRSRHGYHIIKVKKGQVLYHGLGHLLWRIPIQLKLLPSNTLGGDHEMDPSPIVLLGVTSHISRHTAQFLSTHEMTIDFPCTQILHLTMP